MADKKATPADVLAKVQADRAATDAAAAAAGRVAPEAKTRSEEDRRERLGTTFSPDAKKCRQVVKTGNFTSLPALALAMTKVIHDAGAKVRIEELLDRVVNAWIVYARIEGKDENTLVEWMGAENGLLPNIGYAAPEHKIVLRDAWNLLVIAVNEATKVGIQRAYRGAVLTLLVDVDLTADVMGAPGGVLWD